MVKLQKGEVMAEQQPVNPSQSPMLDIWKTMGGASVCGIVLDLTINRLGAFLPRGMAVFALVILLGYVAVSIVYAAWVYPSFFGPKPKLKSIGTVSFWNCAFGGIVFGPLWNHNLTKKSMGISHSLFVVLECIVLIVVGMTVLAAQYS